MKLKDETMYSSSEATAGVWGRSPQGAEGLRAQRPKVQGVWGKHPLRVQEVRGVGFTEITDHEMIGRS